MGTDDLAYRRHLVVGAKAFDGFEVCRIVVTYSNVLSVIFYQIRTPTEKLISRRRTP
jgi:hypothetical protein